MQDSALRETRRHGAHLPGTLVVMAGCLAIPRPARGCPMVSYGSFCCFATPPDNRLVPCLFGGPGAAYPGAEPWPCVAYRSSPATAASSDAAGICTRPVNGVRASRIRKMALATAAALSTMATNAVTWRGMNSP